MKIFSLCYYVYGDMYEYSICMLWWVLYCFIGNMLLDLNSFGDSFYYADICYIFNIFSFWS